MILEQETTKLTLRRTLLCLGIAAGAFLAGAGMDQFDRQSLTAQVCRAGVKQPDPNTQRLVCSISLCAD